MYQKHPRVPIVSRRRSQTYHRRRQVRVFHVEPRAPIEIPPPSRLPWADAITRISVQGGMLMIEYGS